MAVGRVKIFDLNNVYVWRKLPQKVAFKQVLQNYQFEHFFIQMISNYLESYVKEFVRLSGHLIGIYTIVKRLFLLVCIKHVFRIRENR